MVTSRCGGGWLLLCDAQLWVIIARSSVGTWVGLNNRVSCHPESTEGWNKTNCSNLFKTVSRARALTEGEQGVLLCTSYRAVENGSPFCPPCKCEKHIQTRSLGFNGWLFFCTFASIVFFVCHVCYLFLTHSVDCVFPVVRFKAGMHRGKKQTCNEPPSSQMLSPTPHLCLPISNIPALAAKFGSQEKGWVGSRLHRVCKSNYYLHPFLLVVAS